MASSQDTEITLGTAKLLGLFFGLVMVCAVFFALGYTLGRKADVGLAATSAAVPLPVTASGSKPANSATSQTPMTFYKAVEQQNANPQLTPASPMREALAEMRVRHLRDKRERLHPERRRRDRLYLAISRRQRRTEMLRMPWWRFRGPVILCRLRRSASKTMRMHWSTRSRRKSIQRLWQAVRLLTNCFACRSVRLPTSKKPKHCAPAWLTTDIIRSSRSEVSL